MFPLPTPFLIISLKYLLHFLSIFTPILLHLKKLLRYFAVFYDTFSLKKNVCKPWFSANFSIFPSILFCCEIFSQIISVLYSQSYWKVKLWDSDQHRYYRFLHCSYSRLNTYTKYFVLSALNTKFRYIYSINLTPIPYSLNKFKTQEKVFKGVSNFLK